MASAGQIQVLLADDHPIVCKGIEFLITRQDDMRLIAIVGSGEEAYAAYRENLPDVIVIDANMPGSGGMEAVRRVKAWDSGSRIIVFTMYTTDAILAQAVAARVSGFVFKGSPPDTLLTAIRQVAAGESFFDPQIRLQLSELSASAGKSRLTALSPREIDILRLVVDDLNAAQIAELLSLSNKTVSNHVTRIKRKLNVRSTAAIARIAIRHGLIEA
jgi:two-component system, NarL family, invasion response regulator UvrY